MASPPKRGGSAVSGRCRSAQEHRSDHFVDGPLSEAVLAANADGLHALRNGRAFVAFEQFKYAEAVLASRPGAVASAGVGPNLLAVTCSNLGCCHRRVGRPRAALRYLDRALRAEEASASSNAPQDMMSVAATKLNACAVLSDVGRHEEAEKLAQEALELLATEDEANHTREQCSLLAMSCYNLGAEREHLGLWGPAAVAYRQGTEIAQKALGPASPLAKTLADHCHQAWMKAERSPFGTPRRPMSRRTPRAKSKPGKDRHRSALPGVTTAADLPIHAIEAALRMRRSSDGAYSRGLDGWRGAELEAGGSTGSSGFHPDTHPGWDGHCRGLSSEDVLGEVPKPLTPRTMQTPRQISANGGSTPTWAPPHMCRTGSRTDSRSLHGHEMSATSLGQIF